MQTGHDALRQKFVNYVSQIFFSVRGAGIFGELKVSAN
jgi:hypothetical protein